MKRVLVVGHRGMLGSALMELLGAADSGAELHGADLPEIDITDPRSLTRVLDECQPKLVINCAAFTRVDDAETHVDEAMRVNGEGAGNVASAAAAHGARVVHVSTDFVFDGRKEDPYVESDTPRPLSVYGSSKLEGERRVAAVSEEHLIVRTSWLYGPGGRNFVTTILELAGKQDELRVVDDQHGCPTYTRDLARAIWALCQAEARDIVHAAGRGSCSWYEFACEIVRLSAFDAEVRPVTSDEFKRPAERPANSVLDTSRLRELTGFRFPHWTESLADYWDALSLSGRGSG
ncbi:MAG: hypothetical protein AMS16_00810 [Planctomycetes bacterium DG_58]|nr:MAG: hypothetical protein AMS16_00810 [Planctomycetes bacterium DG_58]